MAHWVKRLATMSEDVSSTLGLTQEKEAIASYKLSAF